MITNFITQNHICLDADHMLHEDHVKISTAWKEFNFLLDETPLSFPQFSLIIGEFGPATPEKNAQIYALQKYPPARYETNGSNGPTSLYEQSIWPELLKLLPTDSA